MSDTYSKNLSRLLVAWALLAIVVVALGVFVRLPVFAAQAAIALQILIFFAVLAFAPGFRGYLLSRDLRLLTAFHVWRTNSRRWFRYRSWPRVPGLGDGAFSWSGMGSAFLILPP